MLGTGNLSKDVDRHHYSCIFCWYQQETSGDKLEPEQEYGVEGGRQGGAQRGPDPGTHINTTASDSHHSGRGIRDRTSPGDAEAEQEKYD